MAHPVVHFEVCGPDAAALQKYYSDLFGWKVDADNPMGYGMVSADEGGIAGGIAGTTDGSPRVTFYVMTDDLQATLDSAERLGDKTVLPPMTPPGGPSIAMFADPQGNHVGLLKG